MSEYNFDEFKYPLDKRYDFTIVGAGTAGIFLAVKLALKGRNVLIIESGQNGINPESQQLNTAINSGNKLMNTHNWGRKRALGGTTLAWGGQALPFCEIDFKKNDWVPNSGWPIDYNDLLYHYSRANEFMGVDLLDYRNEIFKLIKISDPGFDKNKLDFHVSKWAKEKNFYKILQKYNLPNIDIIYNALLKNVTHENGKIKSVEIINNKGKSLNFPISNLILANGTIESVRTLLHNKLSNSPLLGKAFMDHPCIEVGFVVQKDEFKLQSLFAPHITKGKYFSLRLSLAEQEIVNKKLLSCSAGLMFSPKSGETNPYTEIKLFLKGLKPKNLIGAVKHSKSLFSSLLIFLKYGFHFKSKFEGKVVLMTEQEPSLNSTIELTNELDLAGLPVPAIQWEISPKTWETIVTTSINVKEEFNRLGLGNVILYPHVKLEENNWKEYLSDVCHHMGGAKMSENPEEGVVDKNLKVWGMENLYVCSPAVFPTGSHSNPVLTLLALSNRLSDFLHLFTPKVVGDSKSLSDSVSSASISY